MITQKSQASLTPEIYKDIGGWFDFDDVYEQAARQLPSGSTFVELGVWHGKSLCYFAEWCRILNKRINIAGIDKFGGDVGNLIDWQGNDGLRIVKQNLSDVQLMPPIRLIKGDSFESATLFKDESVDFIWIDTEHEYETLCREIIAWYPKVKPGGTIGGHDLLDSFPGIRKALDIVGLKYKPVSATSWISKKPK